MELCCGKPDVCTLVCPAKPEEYLLRLNEVGGFKLNPIPGHVGVPCTTLPDFVPIIYNGSGRHEELAYDAIAFPLRGLFHHTTGERLYSSKADLFKRLRVAQGTRLVFTGVSEDCHIERYWDVGRGSGVVNYIRELEPDAVTVPNFTFYLNRPRHEDMHNRKRIAIAFAELTEAGVPTALHVNARTLHDFRLWVEFIRKTPAVRTLAFEFGTGVSSTRQPYYSRMLIEMSRQVGRPLTLIVRGGLAVLAELKGAFDRVVFLDSTAFSRTIRRRKGECEGKPKLKWHRNLTPPGVCLHELLAHNIEVCANYVALRGSPAAMIAQVERKTA